LITIIVASQDYEERLSNKALNFQVNWPILRKIQSQFLSLAFFTLLRVLYRCRKWYCSTCLPHDNYFRDYDRRSCRNRK